uniref:KRAB domain-containing protein n=1 Tax=Naja naja TaxID=35670 RepID=A0A8C6XN25_NAJNA
MAWVQGTCGASCLHHIPIARALPQEGPPGNTVGQALSAGGSQEEWQRELYRTVLRSNYDVLVSLDHSISKPDILSQMDQGEEVRMEESEVLENREIPKDPSCTGTLMALTDEAFLFLNGLSSLLMDLLSVGRDYSFLLSTASLYQGLNL